ncbi:hypothetical protein [Streptomyces sp. NPDC059076]|uniref:hypothetical protein n=1 Tax=unclassified Streptomyces TaxID=2593676 RepID=UPI0036D0DC1E
MADRSAIDYFGSSRFRYCDTGQATRARVAGLRDVKLSILVGDEPQQEMITTKKPLSKSS